MAVVPSKAPALPAVIAVGGPCREENLVSVFVQRGSCHSLLDILSCFEVYPVIYLGLTSSGEHQGGYGVEVVSREGAEGHTYLIQM